MKNKHWQSRYGVCAFNPAGERPVFTKCAAVVEKYSKGGFTSRQCMNANGHGPDGAFCKCHDGKTEQIR